MEEDPARAAKRKMIEERVRLAKEQQARQEQTQAAVGPQPKGKALSREEIISKMNTVPVFVVLNQGKDAVSIKDEATGIETIFWHLEPFGAKAHLDAVVAQNPGVVGLHLGVMSLGVAYPLHAGWEDAVSTSTTPRTGATGGSRADAPAKLRHRIVAEPAAGIDLPVYVCGELQNEQMMPVYFNKRDLASAWVSSGRSANSFTSDKLMAVELAKLVEDMQKPVYSLWHTVRFVTSGAAIELLTCQSAANKMVDKAAAKEQAIANGDEPPPLELPSLS